MVPSKWQNDFIYELSPIFTLGPKTTYGSTVTFLPNEVSLDKKIVLNSISLKWGLIQSEFKKATKDLNFT